MNTEVKKKWVEALRSGRYQQTVECLRDESGFCCLGVLCDISHLGQWVDLYKHKAYLDEEGVLPTQVCDWAEIDRNPVVTLEEKWGLAALNDRGYSFAQIADLIEKQL